MWDGTEETQILKKTCGQLYNNSTEHVSEIISAVADICCVKLKCIKRLLIHINHFIKFSIFFSNSNFFQIFIKFVILNHKSNQIWPCIHKYKMKCTINWLMFN